MDFLKAVKYFFCLETEMPLTLVSNEKITEK